MNSIKIRLLMMCFYLLAVLPKMEAQCTSDAGTMNPALLDACASESIVAMANGDETLDGDDVLQFFLHTAAGTSLGTVLSTNTTPEFSFNGGTMTYGVTYYISAVVGNDDGTGNVDLNDPCLSVAAGTPVRWRTPPTATMNTDVITLCPGDSIDVQITVFLSGTGPWTLQWSSNGNPQAPLFVATNPFSFLLTSQFVNSTVCLTSVTDANACNGTVSGCITVTQAAPVVCTIAVTNVSCFGMNDGSATITCSGGTPPYEINWGGTGNTWSNLPPGTYTVVVTDASGCDFANIFTITQPQPMSCTPSVSSSINCQNSEATLFVTCSGGGVPWSYLWSGPNNFNSTLTNPTVVEPGDYYLTITNSFGCFYSDTITVVGNNLDCGSITGTLTTEDDGNCTLDPGENPLTNWMVRATGTNGDEYFGFTDNLGHYQFQAVPDDYVVEAIPPANFWQDCTGPVNLTLEDANDVDTADFHQFQVINCPLLEVDISTPLLRRCFNNIYYVNYCNIGSEAADDAYLEVTLDPLISIVSASLPYTGPVNGVYTFAVGDLEPGDCGNFQFVAYVACNAVLGQTLCAEVHAYPDSLCTPIDPNWSGAFIEITSNCTVDSVFFTITNTGNGDMDEPSYFIVVEDGVMLMTQEVELVAGGDFTIGFPANGSTYALQAQQVEGVPGFSIPSLFVEGCGTNGSGTFSVGFASQLPENDGDYFVSIDCQDVIGSYDPNDKRGYPLGYSDQHIIEVGQMLDYHIRFQNTGTDTAFLVKIQDVIDPSLDIATLRPGASSHPYQLEIHQDTLLFIFENILLPDSNVNEPGSHGFVKFRIGQRAGLPLGTVIENEAAIFFDFNDPILTNKTRHKIGEQFVLDAGETPFLTKNIKCLVYPNPMGEEAVIVLQGIENQVVDLRLYDLTGRYLRSEKITGGMGKIRKNGLPAGLYFYEIRANGLTVGQGKVAVE